MRRDRGRRGGRTLAGAGVTLGAVVALAATSCGSPEPPPQQPAPPPTATGAGVSGPLPQVSPNPSSMKRLGQDVAVRGKIELVVDESVDQPARDLVSRVLRDAGASDVVVRTPGPPAPDATLSVRLGSLHTPDIRNSLEDVDLGVPRQLPPEGYALAARGSDRGSTVTLGGVDADGMYYAAQTLRQLVSPGRIAGAGVVDSPSMAHRGSIEGFYGEPWSHAERMDQLAFYGDTKMNTYVYAPKDDPYHREKWRQPYPAPKRAELGDLVNQARRHHVDFTFALSPGKSICYSDSGDYQALQDKLQSMYDLGVRSFYIPMDDIDYTEWNCSGDQAKYGAPSKQTAGQAQVDLLNRVQRDFLASHPDTKPLQTVPTEYHDLEDSPYKKIWREQLDKRVQVMWTGDGVVPDGVKIDQAKQANAVWGRKLLLWDNYPVNDFDATAGRVMLGSYAERQKGLDGQLNGITVNPMNQAAASKIVEFGAADFSWNDRGFDAQRSWSAAADYLARGDKPTADAVRALADLEHLAPLPSGRPWLPPAPELNRRLVDFQSTWDGGNKQQALDQLRPYAQLIADVPERLRAGAPKDFVEDTEPWIRAAGLWGEALLSTLDGLHAKWTGDDPGAQRGFDRSASLVRQAQQIHTVPGKTRPQGPVKVGDGVLDVFLRNAPALS